MKVFFGARLFDGVRFLDDHALVVEDGVIRALVDVEERPRGGEAIDCGGGILAPGLVDWQINGGGGVLFNAEPTVEGVARIARAFRREGVTGFLPTVVTDAPAVLAAALSAAREAERCCAGRARDPCRGSVHRPATSGYPPAAMDSSDARGRRRDADRSARRGHGRHARAAFHPAAADRAARAIRNCGQSRARSRPARKRRRPCSTRARGRRPTSSTP